MDHEISISYYEKALFYIDTYKLSEDENKDVTYKIKKADICYKLGEIYIIQRKKEQAEKNLTTSVELYKKIRTAIFAKYASSKRREYYQYNNLVQKANDLLQCVTMNTLDKKEDSQIEDKSKKPIEKNNSNFLETLEVTKLDDEIIISSTQPFSSTYSNLNLIQSNKKYETITTNRTKKNLFDTTILNDKSPTNIKRMTAFRDFAIKNGSTFFQQMPHYPKTNSTEDNISSALNSEKSKFKELSTEEKSKLSTEQLAQYRKDLTKEINTIQKIINQFIIEDNSLESELQAPMLTKQDLTPSELSKLPEKEQSIIIKLNETKLQCLSKKLEYLETIKKSVSQINNLKEEIKENSSTIINHNQIVSTQQLLKGQHYLLQEYKKLFQSTTQDNKTSNNISTLQDGEEAQYNSLLEKKN